MPVSKQKLQRFIDLQLHEIKKQKKDLYTFLLQLNAYLAEGKFDE